MSHFGITLNKNYSEVIKVVITVNDYKEIRQRYLAGESQRSIAKTLGISRNTVKKYCDGSAVPWERKTPIRQSTVLTDDVLSFIQDCLNEDKTEGLKKQQHTAKRIFDRLVSEKGFTGGESTIRKVVHDLKGKTPTAFLPLQFDPGQAVQIDWGEATIYLQGEKMVVNLFCARLCYSCRPFVLAYRRQNEESFLDAIVKVFELMQGVPSRVIFDNGKVAVKDGFGAHARMQQGYSTLSAHYGFDAIFCNPAQGHEKGLVEGLVGWARRNICVPVPKVKTLQELNDILLKRCLDYESHQVKSRKNTVGILFQEEIPFLHPLPKYAFETAKCINVRVNALSTVRFRTNTYSVPTRYVGHEVSVKGYPEVIKIYWKGNLISTHDRLMGKNQTSYHLEDYMELLESRPRAIFDAAPVKQNVPASVLEDLRKQQSKNNVLSILDFYAKQTSKNSVIQDTVTVSEVDLRVYDSLCIGKEVNGYD